MIIESLSQPISLSRRTYHDVWRLLIIMACVSCIGVGLAWLTTFYTPILAVAMLAGALFGPYLLKNPFILLLVALIFIPMDGIDIYFPKGLSAVKIMSLTTLAFFLGSMFLSDARYNLVGGLHMPLIGGLVLIVLIGLFDANYPSETINTLSRLLRLVILYSMVWNLTQTKQHFQWLIFFIVVGVTISTGYGIHAFLTSPLKNYRAEGLTSHPNILGNWTALAFPMALSFAIAAPKRWMRWVMAIVTLLILFGLITTFSRGSTIAALVSVPIIIWRMGDRHRVRLIGLIIIAAAIVLPFVPDRFYERFSTLEDSSADFSVMRRETYLFFAQREFIEHPWVGVGLGNFEELYAQSEYRILLDEQDQIKGRAAHNTYVHLAVETGMMGFIIFVSMLALAWYNLARSQKYFKQIGDMLTCRLTQGFEASLVCFLVLCLFGSRQYEEVPWLFFSVSSALITIMLKHEQIKFVESEDSLKGV